MYCANCGSALQEGARFCNECGAEVPSGAKPVAAADVPPPVVPTAFAAHPAFAAAPASPTPPVSAAPQAPVPPPAQGQAGPPPPPPIYASAPPSPPPPTQPPGRHPALIPGIVTAVIIVAAGLGIGLFFGLKDDGSATEAESTTTTAVAASTTTTAASTTTTTAPVTTTSMATTTSLSTTTTQDVITTLAQRAAAWMDLLESIPVTGQDMTAEIAAYLRPQSDAQERAAEYQADWSTPADPYSIIQLDSWDEIVDVIVEPDGSRAVTVNTIKLECADGLTTRGLEVLGWQREGDEWFRSIYYQPLTPTVGPLVPFGGAIRLGDLLWAPVTLHELKHLGVDEGPTADGMFMTVEFYVSNPGTNPRVPASFPVSAVDGNGQRYDLSATADDWWSGDVEDRAVSLYPGEWAYLWYTFEIPEGLDLQSVQFWVMLPGV